MSEELYYKVRCDKHVFSPYAYCEMCMIRTELQQVIEKATKETNDNLSQIFLAISVLNDCFSKLDKQMIKVNEYLKNLKGDF